MKAKFVTFIVLAVFWSGAIVIPSCGKKDETTTTIDTNKTNQQQQTIQQNTEQQQTVKKDSVKTDVTKKEEDKLKSGKKEEDKLKSEKKEEVKKEQVPSVDFSATFSKKCAKCHGKDGSGKVEGVPNLTLGETKGKSLNQLKTIIENGKKGKTEDDEDMPSFKSKLTPEEIDAAAKYVKGL